MFKELAHTGSVYLDTLAWASGRSAPLVGPRRSARHIGLLSWYLPPHTNAGVFRPASWLRHSQATGWRITAVGSSPPASEYRIGAELNRHVQPPNRLLEFAASRRVPSWRLTPEIDGGFVNAVDMTKTLIGALRGERAGALVATGPPFCTFVAGYMASRYLCCPLVLDYRDEWTECPFDFVSRGKSDRAWEVKCLNQASLVIYTTESFLLHAVKRFPAVDLARKAIVIPNGTELEDFERRDHATRPSKGPRFELAHIGALAGHTPPNEFLDALAEGVGRSLGPLARIQLNLVGRRSREADAVVSSIRHRPFVTVTDQVAKSEAVRQMQAADALLLLADERLERYMPSKLFDYIAARRPILVFGHEGEATRVVRDLQVGVICRPSDGSAGLAAAIEALEHIDLNASEHKVRVWLEAHRRDVLAKRFFDAIETIVDD